MLEWDDIGTLSVPLMDDLSFGKVFGKVLFFQLLFTVESINRHISTTKHTLALQVTH